MSSEHQYCPCAASLRATLLAPRLALPPGQVKPRNLGSYWVSAGNVAGGQLRSAAFPISGRVMVISEGWDISQGSGCALGFGELLGF